MNSCVVFDKLHDLQYLKYNFAIPIFNSIDSIKRQIND